MAEKNGFLFFHPGLDQAGRATTLDRIKGLAFVIQGSANRIRFDQWPVEHLEPSGQAFGPDIEVRWTPVAGSAMKPAWEMLVLTELAGFELDGWERTPMDVDPDGRIYLWGQTWASLQGAAEAARLPKGWVQAEVDGALNYPLEPGKDHNLVSVTTRTYRRAGIACLTRFTGLQAVKGRS